MLKYNAKMVDVMSMLCYVDVMLCYVDVMSMLGYVMLYVRETCLLTFLRTEKENDLPFSVLRWGGGYVTVLVSLML